MDYLELTILTIVFVLGLVVMLNTKPSTVTVTVENEVALSFLSDRKARLAVANGYLSVRLPGTFRITRIAETDLQLEGEFRMLRRDGVLDLIPA